MFKLHKMECDERRFVNAFKLNLNRFDLHGQSLEIWGNNYMNTAFADESTKQILDRNKVKSSFKEEQKMIAVGLWKPFDGLKMHDVLFPHISHGFRGKVFHIITYHVNRKTERDQKAADQSFQNPPWQYVSSNESGIVGKSSGVIIDILNELSKKMNFTYVLHLAQASTSMNSSDDLNGTVSSKPRNFI